MHIRLIFFQCSVIIRNRTSVSGIQIQTAQCHMVTDFPDKSISRPSRRTRKGQGTVGQLCIPDILKPLPVKMLQIKIQDAEFRGNTCIRKPSLPFIPLTAVGGDGMHIAAHSPDHGPVNPVKILIRAGKACNARVIGMYCPAGHILCRKL